MKNIFKYGLYSVIAAMSLVSVSSCTDEYSYDPAAPVTDGGAKAQIVAESTDYTFEGDDKQEFTFTVTRPDASQAATVGLECNSSKVSVPATVEFAAGEKEKEVTATASLDLEEREAVTIKVADKDADIYSQDGGYYQQVFNLYHDYAWEDAGTCTFVDVTLSNQQAGATGVKIQKYPKAANKYRIVKPFEAALGAEGSGDIVFYLNEDGSAKSVEGGAIKLGLSLNTSSGRQIFDLAYYTSGNYAGYCNFLSQNNVYQINMILTTGGSPYTTYTCMFQWDEQWPGTNK